MGRFCSTRHDSRMLAMSAGVVKIVRPTLNAFSSPFSTARRRTRPVMAPRNMVRAASSRVIGSSNLDTSTQPFLLRQGYCVSICGGPLPAHAISWRPLALDQNQGPPEPHTEARLNLFAESGRAFNSAAATHHIWCRIASAAPVSVNNRGDVAAADTGRWATYNAGRPIC